MTTETVVSVTSERNKTISLALLMLVGLAITFLLSRSIDARRPPPDPNAVDESLYLNGKTARRMSLGFNGLAADWYWMRSLQYVGGKIINLPANVALDNLSQLNLKLLPSLLDTATTLDPQFLDPYEYAAIVLPAINVDEAIRITKKGIEANPSAWRLYQHLGFIYWQQQNYQAASEAYGKGAQIPEAPAWMEAMKARMAVEGGSRSTAREIYTRMYEQSTDEKVRDMARRRLLQIDALDQMDAMRKVMATYFERTRRCPANWKEIEPALRAIRIPTDSSGAPLDPSGTPYVWGKTNCDVKLNPKSEVPAKCGQTQIKQI
jgi:tetratricopeptide (TPR) repeat protein